MVLDDLLTKAKQGDTAAFGEIYDIFAERIFRYIKIKVKNQQQAEDLLQDIFYKAWIGIKSLSLENLNFSAWLYKVANNTINDYYRKVYRTPVMVEINENLAQQENLYYTDRFNFNDIEIVRESMERLPVQYKQVLELRFIQEFSLDETAKTLGRTNLAVRLLQHRALKKLQTVIKKRYGVEYEKV
jgi:RNA polymerase sigma-70 factor, ECF subfamily